MRWHVGEPVWRRELHRAILSEITLTASPAYGRDTWVTEVVDSAQEARWRKLADHARRYCQPTADESAADITVEAPQLFDLAGLLTKLYASRGYEYVEYQEFKLVQQTVEKHPDVRTVDLRYGRSLRSCRELLNRRFQHQQQSTPPPSRGTEMRHNEHVLARREILGPGELSAAETVTRIRKFEQELERRSPGASRRIQHYKPYIDDNGRWHAGAVLSRKGTMSIAEAEARMARRHL